MMICAGRLMVALALVVRFAPILHPVAKTRDNTQLAPGLHDRTSTLYNTQSVGTFVKISGTSSLHDWEMKGLSIGGYIELGAGVALDKSKAVPVGLEGGKIPIEAHVTIPVDSLHSLAEHIPGTMDDLMQKAMKADAFRTIEYTLTEMDFKGSHEAGKPFNFAVKWYFVIAGKTNKVSFPATIEPLDDGKIKVIGTALVKMTDYGVMPPAPNFGLGMMKCGDGVTITFDWMLKEKK
jgi:hypothetical protein